MGFFEKWIIGKPEQEGCESKALASQTITDAKPVKVEPVSVPVAAQIVEVPAVAIAKKTPDPPSAPVDKMTRPFSVRSIEHDVLVDGVLYHIRADRFRWGACTDAYVAISLPGCWQVESSYYVDLTKFGRPAPECVDRMIYQFANAGMLVNRRLIDSCLCPIQHQVLEIERRIRNFE